MASTVSRWPTPTPHRPHPVFIPPQPVLGPTPGSKKDPSLIISCRKAQVVACSAPSYVVGARLQLAWFPLCFAVPRRHSRNIVSATVSLGTCSWLFGSCFEGRLITRFSFTCICLCLTHTGWVSCKDRLVGCYSAAYIYLRTTLSIFSQIQPLSYLKHQFTAFISP